MTKKNKILAAAAGLAAFFIFGKRQAQAETLEIIETDAGPVVIDQGLAISRAQALAYIDRDLSEALVYRRPSDFIEVVDLALGYHNLFGDDPTYQQRLSTIASSAAQFLNDYATLEYIYEKYETLAPEAITAMSTLQLKLYQIG